MSDKRKMTNHDVTTPWVDGTTGEVLSITWHYRRGAPLSFTFGPPLADDSDADRDAAREMKSN